MRENRKVALIIMDGWGNGTESPANAIFKANTPFVDGLYTKYPHAQLTTHGEAVGLPDGQMGNSEVGHLNIGAGRVVYQELQRIGRAVETGELAQNKVLKETLEYSITQNKTLHLMGLVSDGGVHSHIKHLIALCRIAEEAGVEKVCVHAFTDGRDTDPKSGVGFIKELQNAIADQKAELVTVIGRYYAMDRDKRWERTKIAYDALVHGEGKSTDNFAVSIEAAYSEGTTDEFLMPIIGNDAAASRIKSGDAVICFNFRTDRCRQITDVLTQNENEEHQMDVLDLHYTTMTKYDDSFKGVHIIFEKEHIKNSLGEVLAKHSKKQIRIAETEKYPHVTFFFSGGQEAEFDGEKRILIPSPKVATYDLQPEMSAPEITAAILPEIKSQETDFICLNFANADMVGHTGDFQAAIKAVETVDNCVQQMVEQCLESGYDVVLTADHGNADFMINEDGSPNTAHTTNLVPVFFISAQEGGNIKDGKLGDLAPSILHLMGIEAPEGMSGNIIIRP